MTPTPQDAEAVARPDLTAETLAMLEAQRKVVAYTHEHWHQQDALLAHAAACVREVAAFRAATQDHYTGGDDGQ